MSVEGAIPLGDSSGSYSPGLENPEQLIALKPGDGGSGQGPIVPNTIFNPRGINPSGGYTSIPPAANNIVNFVRPVGGGGILNNGQPMTPTTPLFQQGAFVFAVPAGGDPDRLADRTFVGTVNGFSALALLRQTMVTQNFPEGDTVVWNAGLPPQYQVTAAEARRLLELEGLVNKGGPDADRLGRLLQGEERKLTEKLIGGLNYLSTTKAQDSARSASSPKPVVPPVSESEPGISKDPPQQILGTANLTLGGVEYQLQKRVDGWRVLNPQLGLDAKVPANNLDEAARTVKWAWLGGNLAGPKPTVTPLNIGDNEFSIVGNDGTYGLRLPNGQLSLLLNANTLKGASQEVHELWRQGQIPGVPAPKVQVVDSALTLGPYKVTIRNQGGEFSVAYQIGGNDHHYRLNAKSLEEAANEVAAAYNASGMPGLPKPTTPFNPEKVEPVRIAGGSDVDETAKKYGLSPDDIRREMDANPGMSAEQAAQAIKARVLNGPTGAGQGVGGGGTGGAAPTASAGGADGDEPNPLTAVQQGEWNDAQIVERWAAVAADLLAKGVDPKIALKALQEIEQVPTNFSKVRPWEVSEGSLADIVSEVAEGKTLVLYTKREAEDLQSLMQDPEKSKNLVFVEVSDKDTNKTAAVAGILGREDIGTIDRVVAVGGAGVKDLAVTVLAAGRGDPAAVRARFLGADPAAINDLVNLGQNQLKSDIDYVSVPTILSTTAPGTPFAVVKEGNTVVIDQLPALTVVPLDKLQALSPEKLQALTASGLTDYFAGLSYAAGRASQEGLSLKEAIARYVPEAMKVFEWFEANPGSFDRQHLLMAAYALRDYSLNSKPPVGGEHDLWDALVSTKLTAETRATHGQVVAMGSLIQLYLQAQRSGDFDMFNRMRDLYSNMGAPVTAQGLDKVGMTKELLVKAIEHQSQQPTKRPSLIHDRFSQIEDPAARRQAIEQMLDAVFFQPR